MDKEFGDLVKKRHSIKIVSEANLLKRRIEEQQHEREKLDVFSRERRRLRKELLIKHQY